jgi:branched-subunit amino acid ABC-type transport system permease component
MTLVPYIVAGLVTGSLYGLSGIGLVLTYRTSGVLNFGHGAIAAAAAFAFYDMHVQHHIPWPIAAIVTIAFMGVAVGWALEWLTRQISSAPAATVVVTTVGLFLALDGGLLVNTHDVVRGLPAFLPQSGFHIGHVLVTWEEVIDAGIALSAALGLYLFLQRALIGVAMRAVVDNRTLVQLTGERPSRVRRTAWVIGCAFAAVSGILLARSQELDPTQLTLLVVEAFGACAIGRFSSLPLTYLGGLIVGLMAAIATDLFTSAALAQVPSAVPFLVLIVALLAVPASRLPRGSASFRGLVSNAPPLGRRAGTALTVGVAALLVAIPPLVGSRLPVWISAESEFLVFGSLALLVWTSGQISLCQVSFAALGATSMAHLTSAGVPWLIALLVAGLLTVPIGALVSIPAIRLSGIYLALVTLGFGLVLQLVFYPTFLMFGKSLTLSTHRPVIGPITGSDTSLYYVGLVVAAAAAGILVVLHRSRFGRLLRAMSESPTMLSTLGLSVNITRLLVFCLAAFLSGVGGAMSITQFAASGTVFEPIESLLLVAVLAICAVFGTRLLLTSVLASLLLVVLPGYAHGFGSDEQTLLFGLVAIGAGLVLAGRDRLSVVWRRATAATPDRHRHSPVAARRVPPPDPSVQERALEAIR